MQWVPVYDVMEQSQVKFSHCWMHTPMLAHESSWQVVLGPGESRESKKKKEIPRVCSQAMLKAATEPKERRIHAEDMHSRETGLHYVGLGESRRSRQWHHMKPDPSADRLKG